MLSKYQPNFHSLTPTEAALVAGHIARIVAPASIGAATGATGDHLFAACQHFGLTQAQVILAVAPDPSPEAVVALEKLVGKPIVREAPKPKKPAPSAPRPRGASVRGSDKRVVLTVVPNPKKAGSASAARYDLYRVGMTVDQFVAAGGTTADVKWDTEKGFITLGDPA